MAKLSKEILDAQKEGEEIRASLGVKKEKEAPKKTVKKEDEPKSDEVKTESNEKL